MAVVIQAVDSAFVHSALVMCLEKSVENLVSVIIIMHFIVQKFITILSVNIRSFALFS